MRITMLTNLFPPDVHGGYELLARDVASALRARGHRVEVLTTGASSEGDGPDVHRVLKLSRPFGSAAGRDRLRQAAAATYNRAATSLWVSRHGRPDATLVMSLRRLGPAAVRALGAPSVLTVNDDWPVAFAREPAERDLRSTARALLDASPLGRPTLAGLRPAGVVYLSNAVRSYVRSRGSELPEGSVCAQGVDTTLFAPGEPTRWDRPLKLLSVGRLHPDKAPDVAIDAVASLRAMGIESSLDLAGLSDDRAYEASLRARARELGVGDAVRFLGPVPRAELPGLYRSANAFLFLSRLASEGLGLTWMEAMACGVPVVASGAGGAHEALGSGSLCATASECSGSAVAREIAALACDPGQRERFVRAGLGAVRERYSLERYVDALERELEGARRRRS